MEPNRPITFTDPLSQLPVQIVLEEKSGRGELIRRVYILRRTRSGGLLLNRDELASNQAA